MSKKDTARAQWLQETQKTLLERKKIIEQALADSAEEKDSERLVQDLGDQAFSLSMDALKNALQDAEYHEYRMILKALEAIKQGTYGECIDCGQEISEKRLRVQPNAARCISCQEALEESM